MPATFQSWLSIFLIALILVSGVAGFIIGFEYGYHRGSTNNISETHSPLELLNSSSPIFAGPFTYNFGFKGEIGTAYVPVVYLPVSYSSTVYVQYECPSSCEQYFSPTISSFNITSYIPLVFLVQGDGTMIRSSNVLFNTSTVIQETNNSEILVYNLSNEGNNSGYYSFIFPYTCGFQPLLYIGSHATDVDFDLVRNWLEANYLQYSQNCPEIELDLNILGFTNTYYNHLTVSFLLPSQQGNGTS